MINPRMNEPITIQNYIVSTFQKLTSIKLKGLKQYDYYNRYKKV